MMEGLDVEKAVLHLGGIVLEPLIGAAARAGRFAELAASCDLLGLDAADGFLNERVVVGLARERGRVRLARGGAQNLVLAFSDGAAFLVHPGEGIVAVG